MKYFKKELVSSPLKLPNGFRVLFTEVADDIGVLATDDGYLIGELNNAIKRRVGGVVAISSDEYEELKKNQPGLPLPPPWVERHSQHLAAARQPAHESHVVEDSRPLPPAPPPPSNPPPLSVPDTVPVAPVVAKAGPRRGGRFPKAAAASSSSPSE